MGFVDVRTSFLIYISKVSVLKIKYEGRNDKFVHTFNKASDLPHQTHNRDVHRNIVLGYGRYFGVYDLYVCYNFFYNEFSNPLGVFVYKTESLVVN